MKTRRLMLPSHLEMHKPPIRDLMDLKSRMKYIRHLETSIRRSAEMRDIIKLLKSDGRFNRCAFFPEVSLERGRKITIEIHHHPFTLFSLVDLELRRREMSSKPTDEFSVCNSVVSAHFEGIVGLIPLSKTAHDMAHSAKLFIPLQLVFGNIAEYVRRYSGVMNGDEKARMTMIAKVSSSWTKERADESLTVSPVMIDSDCMGQIPTIKKLQGASIDAA